MEYMDTSELKVNLLHALEDFLGMYEQEPSEVVLIESIANSIDAGATELDIYLDEKTKTYNLTDNGRGMDAKTFENYHTIALSSKDKSKGIGFAGVGAKIYLAAWSGASVITETYGIDGKFRSIMYRDGTKLLYKYEMPTIEQKGTTYKVSLSDNHLKDMQENIEKYILYWYNWTITSGLTIRINGKQLDPWNPKKIIECNEILTVSGHKFPFHICLTKEDLPDDKRNIEYTVFGKKVKSEIPTSIWEVKPEYKYRIYCRVEADPLSRFLTSNKEDFQKNQFRNAVFSKARMQFETFARDNDLMIVSEVKTSEGDPILKNDITEELNKILEAQEFSWLNPWTANVKGKTIIKDDKGDIGTEETFGIQKTAGTKGGIGNGNGVDTPGPDEGKSQTRNESGDQKGTEKPRMRKGLGIVMVEFEDDPREAWVELENRAVAVNNAHPLAKKVFKTNDKRLIRYNLTRVIIAALLGYAEENIDEERSVSDAFKIESEILIKLFTSAGANLQF